MKRTSIAYTDDIGGLASSTTLIAAIGEFKTMTASFELSGSCGNLDDVVAKYNHAFAMASPEYPKSEDYWRFTMVAGMTTGVYYDMQLIIDGLAQGSTYQSGKNVTVEIRKDTDTSFTIRHKFYVTDDVNGFIGQNGINTYSKWFQQPDIDGAVMVNNNQVGTSAYDVSKYFVTWVEVTDINTTESDKLLNYDTITALYYDNYPVSTSTYTSNWTNNNPVLLVNENIPVTVSFDSPLFVPTSAKLLLINNNPDNSMEVVPGIIEGISLPVISVVGTTYTLTGTLKALTVGDKEIVAIVYYNGTSTVVSAKMGNPTTGSPPTIPNTPLKALIGCYPTIISVYDDYNNVNVGACIESTPYERVRAGFVVSKTAFNKIGIGAGCFPLGFANYNKFGTFKLVKQSTGEVLYSQGFGYNASSGIWTTGDLEFTDNVGFLRFAHEYRNIFDYLGEVIEAQFLFEISYSSSYSESVMINSLNRVLNYDNAEAVPRIDYIEITDPTSGAVIDSIDSNIMTINPTCLNKFTVKICREVATLADDYNIIAIFHEQGNNLIDEEESYAGVLTQETSDYISAVPVSFGVGAGNECARFDLDLTGLDRTKTYELAVIIKKI